MVWKWVFRSKIGIDDWTALNSISPKQFAKYIIQTLLILWAHAIVSKFHELCSLFFVGPKSKKVVAVIYLLTIKQQFRKYRQTNKFLYKNALKTLPIEYLKKTFFVEVPSIFPMMTIFKKCNNLWSFRGFKGVFVELLLGELYSYLCSAFVVLRIELFIPPVL